MSRNIENPDEVISFGFFDGNAEELRRVAAEMDYPGRLEAAHSALAGSGTRRGLSQWVTLMSLICSWSPRTVRSWM
jgi:hypothetical protein